MSSRKARTAATAREDWAHLNPAAAGVDSGAEESWAGVPPARDPQPVRAFGPCTPDLQAVAEGLAQGGCRP